VFKLEVTDGISHSDTDTVQVKIYRKSDRQNVTAPASSDLQVLFDSDSGDYIGGGQHIIFTSGITVSAHGGRVKVDISDKSTWFNLEFEVPNNVKTFAVGNYANAERAAFRSPMRPGLDIGGDGRGCNTLTGWFRVLQAQFHDNGTIQNLAINFKQNCEGGSKALFGAVRINSSLPLNVEGLFAIAGSPVEAIEGANVTLNGGQSFKRDGTSLKYMWLQQSGPPVQLRGSTSATPSFTAPTGLPLGGTVLVFKLEVTDGISHSDTDTVQVKVYSKSDRQNYIEFRSQEHDFIGNGQYYHFDQTNTVLGFSGSQSGVHISLSSSDRWEIDMVPASGRTFKVGDYEGAERYPFQAADKPGLSVHGNGRGCNTLTGRFNVTVAQTDSINIIAFGAEFEQHCEGSTDALFGTIRYNYLDPHVPNAVAGAYQIVTPGQTVTLDGSGSSDPMKNSISYQWNQTEGPKVMLHNYSSPKPTFVAPTVTSSQHLVFSLLVTNNLGYISSAVTQVIINPVLNSISNSE
jgi:hypothetical protein